MTLSKNDKSCYLPETDKDSVKKRIAEKKGL